MANTVNPIRERMAEALYDYRIKNGREAEEALLRNIAGVGYGGQVPDDKLNVVIAACAHGRAFASVKKASTFDDLAARAYAKWNNPPAA